MKDSKIPLQEITLLVAGFIILIILQVVFPRAPFFDEDDYLSNVALLHQYGFGKTYLVHLVGSAGPLYSMVHFLFEPLTGLKTPQIRLVNTLFLVGAAYFTFRTLCVLNPAARFYALYIMAVPMTYVIGGLALTEMPALFFFSASIFLLIKNTVNTAIKSSLIQLAVAGLCMGLAIAGRQPYLLVLAAFPVLFVTNKNNSSHWLPLIITVFFSLLLPCYLFMVWNGLVPTIESRLYKDLALAGTAYRPDFFMLCVFYFAISMLLIAPGFFWLAQSRKTGLGWTLLFIVLTTANFFLHWIQILPAKPLLEKLLPSAVFVYFFSVICGSAVIFSCLYFTVCLYQQLNRLQFPKELLFFTVSLLLIAVSCAKITSGFSSLYAGQAITLIVLTGSYFYRNLKYNKAGIIIGSITGLTSLVSYFIGQ